MTKEYKRGFQDAKKKALEMINQWMGYCHDHHGRGGETPEGLCRAFKALRGASYDIKKHVLIIPLKEPKDRDTRDRRHRRDGALPSWMVGSLVSSERRHGPGRRGRD